MLKKTYIHLPAVLVFSLLFASTVFAHNTWLNPADHFPQVGSTVDIGIGWGHTYPAGRIDQEVKEGRIAAIHAIDPSGADVDLTRVSTDTYQLKVDKPGAWLITSRITPGFFTTTPDGRKWGDKKSIENPIKCTNFHIQAKTLLIAGGSDQGLSNGAGGPLELIPLTDPSKITAGDAFSVRLLFDGKPLANEALRATYAGFAPKEKGKKKHYPVEVRTDARGEATLALNRAGYWMIMLSHRCPFTDTATCDEYMYNVAFTFEVPE